MAISQKVSQPKASLLLEKPLSINRQGPFLKVISRLKEKKRCRAYLIGGFLRDYLLGRECLDMDFAVSENAVSFARLFAKQIKGAFVLLDEEHGCARVVKNQKEDILTFDFADFRDKDLLGDLAHRDFTINTLCVDLDDIDKKEKLSRILFDPQKGLHDIKKKRIKMVSGKSFTEDPLRLVRAFSLQAMLDFKIEHKTLNRIKKDACLLNQSAYERIRDELFKVLLSPRAAKNLKQMDQITLMERIIPQVQVMYNVKQGTYHHLDVWPHSLETVVQLEKLFVEMENKKEINGYLDEQLAGMRTRRALLKLAALLHDIGKPDTKRREDGRLTFHGHERIGQLIVRKIAYMLKISTRERHILEDMVFFHLRPGYLSNFKRPSDRAIFRFFRDAKEEAVSVLLLSWADQRATRGPLTTLSDIKHHEQIIKRLLKQYFDKKKEKPLQRLISGHDLINQLKLKPSPIFKKILQQIEEQQALGFVKTREQALQLARKMVRK